jgi:hypothetical protein
VGHVTHMGEERNVYKFLMGKPEGKRPLGRPRCRWEDEIRMGFRQIGWVSVKWIQLAQDRDRWLALVDMVMNLRVVAPRSWLVRRLLFASYVRSRAWKHELTGTIYPIYSSDFWRPGQLPGWPSP